MSKDRPTGSGAQSGDRRRADEIKKPPEVQERFGRIRGSEDVKGQAEHGGKGGKGTDGTGMRINRDKK